MTELLTAAQMRAIEDAAIASGEVTGLELMERAGQGVVDAIFEEWPALRATSHRAVVLCGPGNNGGDGFVVARLLIGWGWEVEVFLYGDADKLPPDARVNHERCGGKGWVQPLDEDRALSAVEQLGGGDVVIDAFFGTGLTRPFDAFGKLQLELNDCAFERKRSRDWPYVVAIDIPSGYCSDSGKWLGDDPANAHAHAIRADLTVAFHRAKRGHYLGAGVEASGRLAVKAIGLDGNSDRSREALIALHGLTDNGRGLGRHVVHADPDIVIPGKAFGHKYTHGHALILSGGPGKTGAARLAARGALRIGAGLVTVGCPQKALWEVASHVTAIMVQPLDGPPGLREVLEDQRLNALCLGPGMGLGADTQALVVEALRSSSPDGGPGSGPGRRGVVLDADALTRFERAPETLFDLLHENCVLTPHAGEFARLFPDIAEKLNAPATSGPAYSKVDATRDAAKRAGCTVLFKGPDTVIADQTGRCAINSSAYDRAAPWLATAGSGDVLAGFITGLLAHGFPPMQAAETAAWLHTECALSFGPGLIAEDIPEELPKILKRLS